MKARLAPVLLFAVACRSGSNVTPPVTPPPPAAEAKAMSIGGVKIPVVRVLLDDPRLSQARAFERTKDWALAGKAVHDARPSDLGSGEACAWDYLEGRLFVAANATAEALAAF